ncbi:MAG: DUF6491 family protein [Caulobacteraceae bacterium]
MRPATLLTALAALFCAGAVQAQTPPAPEPAERDCFRNAEIGGWGLIDRNTVRVRINSRRQYALTTLQSARRLRWETTIAVVSRSGWICVGDELGVTIQSFGEIPHAYEVVGVGRLPEEPDAAQEGVDQTGTEAPAAGQQTP